ncbi:MAG: 2-amino-4-hydroxy-6-hydroxymethyldihydropteridine diphosphokinase [Hyphomonadaceae bacterium]|nr:2-amino-4-hydroxy-6-hydroxymethyldihydropteridine diphosphokinase [Hyphomonadaceae bacterium]
MKKRAFIALGTNLPFGALAGPALLRAAVCMLAEKFVVLAASSVWRSPAWPVGAEQPDYHNAVIAADAAGWTPLPLYQLLREVEAAFGRERRERWAARTLDLDLVAMDGFVGAFGDLTLPHPRMHERAFVLAPMAEIAPDWRRPDLSVSATHLQSQLPDVGDCVRLGPLDEVLWPCRIAE